MPQEKIFEEKEIMLPFQVSCNACGKVLFQQEVLKPAYALRLDWTVLQNAIGQNLVEQIDLLQEEHNRWSVSSPEIYENHGNIDGYHWNWGGQNISTP